MDGTVFQSLKLKNLEIKKKHKVKKTSI